jgi:hypothetical protein
MVSTRHPESGRRPGERTCWGAAGPASRDLPAVETEKRVGVEPR